MASQYSHRGGLAHPTEARVFQRDCQPQLARGKLGNFSLVAAQRGLDLGQLVRDGGGNLAARITGSASLVARRGGVGKTDECLKSPREIEVAAIVTPKT